MSETGRKRTSLNVDHGESFPDENMAELNNSRGREFSVSDSRLITRHCDAWRGGL